MSYHSAYFYIRLFGPEYSSCSHIASLLCKEEGRLRLLKKKYRDKNLYFNDDIQGTASVALSGLLTAVKMTNIALKECLKIKQIMFDKTYI
ncbi:NADP-dependent malic enzyme 1-like [Brachionus plicatilis]|uniref:NADP-dependent malic enzyme 1-like n=1 Tax=Brachionus plicatilis TaxID=10195 RepID=A0A3M7T8I3_BRAPC|nr:NADP-dependent malic enzyme 1-like [Brachionus plicatilis]